MKHHTARTAGRILLFVLLIAVALGILLPTLLTVAASFMPQREIDAHYGTADGTLALFPQRPTAEQYTTSLLQTPHYLTRFFNSVWLTLPITLGQLVLSSFAAYSLYRCRNRFRTGVYFLYVLLMLLPYQVTLLPQYLVADALGLLGSAWAVILPAAVSPFAVFLLSRRMRQIPQVQIEAAMLDGAGEWGIFIRVALPQCRPTLWAVSMLIFTEYWNMIEQPLVLFKEPETYPLSIFLSQIDRSQAGIAFAVAVLFLLPPLILFLFGQRHFTAGFGAEDSPAVRTRHRVWRITAVACAVAGLCTLWGITRWADTVNAKHTPQVTVTTATAAIFGDVIYSRVLPPEAVHTDAYGTYVMEVVAEKRNGATVWRVDYEPVTVLARIDDGVALGEGGDWMTVILTADRPTPENSYVTVQED
ncbi:MAG: carbohydrate ABC transporter permease [Ruminococcaceae bacterium]|nr:carbohydrate ABC transporter permease [Oscillospiraceae bacterium]